MSDAVAQATETMIRNLAEKTGKTLDAWVGIARETGLEKHGQIVAHLKAQHGLGHGYANLVATALLSPDAVAGAGGDDLVDAQYAGDRAALRPVYERLVEVARSLGADVEVSPKKTCVSLRRRKQFALLQPGGKVRVDVGINLGAMPPDGRLEAAGSFNSMVSHRVRVERVDQVDDALIGWLRQAYEAA